MFTLNFPLTVTLNLIDDCYDIAIPWETGHFSQYQRFWKKVVNKSGMMLSFKITLTSFVLCKPL